MLIESKSNCEPNVFLLPVFACLGCVLSAEVRGAFPDRQEGADLLWVHHPGGPGDGALSAREQSPAPLQAAGAAAAGVALTMTAGRLAAAVACLRDAALRGSVCMEMTSRWPRPHPVWGYCSSACWCGCHLLKWTETLRVADVFLKVDWAVWSPKLLNQSGAWLDIKRCNHGDNITVAFWWLCTLPFFRHTPESLFSDRVTSIFLQFMSIVE